MSGEQSKPPSNRGAFKIGVICALTLEAGMVEMVFDKIWRKKDGIVFGKLPTDHNTYTLGLIAGHDVVLAHCPDLGGQAAAQVAESLRHSFPKIEIVLVVGICGVAPRYLRQGKLEEIMLGDCVFSTAVVQLDLGENGPDGLRKADGLDALGKPDVHIRGFMKMLQTPINRDNLNADLRNHLQAIQNTEPEFASYPGRQLDRLYRQEYIHTHHPPNQSCNMCETKLGICRQNCEDLGCEAQQLEHRVRPQNDVSPRIHVGYFGSSNSVLKNGKERDNLARSDKIIAFEMEGSGVWEVRPTVIIKAACDYADSHINKNWQSYAAAVAAAGLKAFLQTLELPNEEGTSTS